MNNSSSSHPSSSHPSSSHPSSPQGPAERALVLAGGGAAGNAWQLGLIAGLAEAGLDVTGADLVVGTSSGSTVTAQITSGTRPGDLYAAILAETPPSRPAGGATAPRPARTLSGPDYLAWSNAIIASARDADDMRRTLAAAALELDRLDRDSHPDGESSGGSPAESSGRPGRTRWHDIVAARLPSHDWPAQRVLIPALDARTGQPVVFDRHSAVGLVDAVAASTSALTPYAIGEQRYLNGAYRRGSNADLAAGYRRVLVLDPFSGRSRTPREWGVDLATQVDELRAAGSTVEVVHPDAGAGDVFDAHALDPSTRLPAARGGHQQGLRLAASLEEFWR
ncbi:patatin-like phospholipase family protein [Herbiconiux daphne]|uniref:Patatin-like phospholipase family protein n=1 Tax=Herbiconiux daphne TaxID=2970914 RepID=A0ABT2GW77_9MICO|nr:patatin-like phospholipase family protein [Herbiconiux daphne]MCS5732216.1 patatin-like phospholipase family protein [Herbiconiux daphne]